MTIATPTAPHATVRGSDAHPLVLLSGRKRSGKDTLAERLVKRHGYTRVAFADVLREMLLALDPIVDHDEWTDLHLRLSDVVNDEGWEEAKAHPEVRRLLQRLGTEAGREILGENVWVEHARKKIAAIDGPVVVTDTRFPNELDVGSGLDRAVVPVRIERPGLESDDLHPSETALDDHPFTLRIINSGTVEDLHRMADDVASLAALGRSDA